jgi:hypothetical protein
LNKIKIKIFFFFFFWVFFEKFAKLPGCNQAVGADCLAAGPSNLK